MVTTPTPGQQQWGAAPARDVPHLTPEQQAELITAAIGRVQSELAQGAIASVAPERMHGHRRGHARGPVGVVL